MNKEAGFYCKSYEPDFAHLQHMLATFARHNPENLTLTLSLPATDIEAFKLKFGADIRNLRLVTDESYCGHDLSQYRGWQGQQVCKLMSWRAVEAAHYAVLDSDCYFIRDVVAADILPTGDKPYVACGSSIRTVLKADNGALLHYLRGELTADARFLPKPPAEIADRLDEYVHYKDLDQDNPGAIERSAIPFKVFGSKEWLFYQPGQYFSHGLLRRLFEYFAAHGLTPGDAIKICPWEYNWYGEYAATHGYADTEFRVSPYLHFQEEADLQFARAQNVTEEMMRKNFLFVQMASRHLAEIKFQ